MCNIWTILTAIGTVGATIVALIPIVKDNYRFFWLKIYSASVMPYTYNAGGEKSDEERTLILGITNNKNIDIGIQMARLYIYKKKRLFVKADDLTVCFGSRNRYPDHHAKRLESNEYFLKYNNLCHSSCLKKLQTSGIPEKHDIQKIKILLNTTVGSYSFTVPKKKWNNIISSLSNYTFPH